jgi:hypothetical protein
VTLRVERIAGTNWGGAFGWSTDGTNFTTQNFIEPAGVDDDFQFVTIDLTSNVNYTGTITAIRIYLGEANLDEFYIDTLSVGKFNPQTEILADLSSRLTVAEAGLLNTSTEFTTYTQNGVLLNGSAKVAVIRNATTTYDTVELTDTRGGFTVRDDQDYYLVNEDGTFQAIKIDGNQTVTAVTTPTTFTLDIQSVNFATTIEVGAVLYESAFTQSTRISQTAGTIVLQASETDDEVTSLALIRLDGTGPSTAVTIQGDLVAINDIQITRGDGSDPGVIQTNNFVSGVSGWRIQGTGNAELNDVTVRGSVFVTGGDAATETYADNAAGDALDDALDNLSVTIRSGTKPTQRPNGDALRSGDVWIDTDNGDKPYSYDGSISDFVAAYTQISGGAITTGTIDTARLNVSNIITVGGIATEGYADGVAASALSDAEDYADGVAETVSDATPRIFRQDDEPTTSNRSDNSLQAGDLWIDTDDGDAPYTYSGTAWIRAYTKIDGGSIVTGTLRADLVTIQNASSSPDVVIDANGITIEAVSPAIVDTANKITYSRSGVINSEIYATTELDPVGGDIFVDKVLRIFVSTDVDSPNILRTRDIRLEAGRIRAESPFEARDEMRIYDSTGNIYVNLQIVQTGGEGLPVITFPDYTGTVALKEIDNSFSVNQTVPNASANGHALNRITADGRYGQLGSANTWTDTQGFSGDAIFQNGVTLTGDGANGTVVYAGDDTRTFTIPDVDGNKTFSFINQNESISGVKSFAENTLRIMHSNGNNYARIQHVNAGNRDYILPNQAGTFWTSGNLGLSVSAGAVNPDTTLEIEFNGNRYTFSAQLQP